MEKRRSWTRPVIALAALGVLTVAALAAPASAHLGSFGHLKGHIKKIARKVAKQEISKADTVRETRLFTLPDGGSQALLTHGPFTLTANCDLDVGGNDTANVLISTTQDNSSFDADDENDDFDVADLATARDWASPISVPADTTEVEANVSDGVAVAPDGTTLVLASIYTAVNPPFAPNACAFAGAHVLA
jgi:hypothetical protein